MEKINAAWKWGLDFFKMDQPYRSLLEVALINQTYPFYKSRFPAGNSGR